MTGLGLLALVLIVPAFLYALNEQLKKSHKRSLIKQAQLFMQAAQSRKGLEVVATKLFLKASEKAFYSSSATLLETRTVSDLGAATASIKVSKSIRVGAIGGRSTPIQEWARLDAGELVVTGQRVIFNGSTVNRTLPLDNILTLECTVYGVELSAEGQKKKMVFEVENPLIAQAVIQLCRQADDPSDLSQAKIRLQIEGADSAASTADADPAKQQEKKRRSPLVYVIVALLLVAASYALVYNDTRRAPSQGVEQTPVPASEAPVVGTQAGHEGMPTKVGECKDTRIATIQTRLIGVADSGSLATFENGGMQVSYDRVDEIEKSLVGDDVSVCVVSLPVDCPPDDARGIVYKTTNKRTQGTWTLPDSSHQCGGL